MHKYDLMNVNLEPMLTVMNRDTLEVVDDSKPVCKLMIPGGVSQNSLQEYPNLHPFQALLKGALAFFIMILSLFGSLGQLIMSMRYILSLDF